MALNEKLKVLRKENNYTQKEIANLLNISSVGYGDYERGKSTPDIFTLKKLSLLYKISLDEIMKETEDYDINTKILSKEKNTLNIIKKRRKELSINQEDMAIKLGIARSSYQAIESGKNKMNVNDFFKIIEILQIPINSFIDQDLIVISKKDFNKLINNINELNNLSKKYIHD